MNIEVLRQSVLNGVPIEYTAHCQKRMLERDISRGDIRNCIATGEIIEEYPLSDGNDSEKSLPSYLIMGNKVGSGEIIHIVVGYNGRRFLIISACYPDMQHWMDDYRTRR